MNFKCWFKAIISTISLKIYFPKIIFKVIDKPDELEKMYNLIWQVYALEQKYIDPNRFSFEILKDEYEISAIKIGAFNNGDIIGALRIILPSPKGFYVENDFNIELPEFYYETAELSRLIILKKYRNKLISFGLLKKAFEISKKREIKYWIIVVSEKIKNYFSRFFGVKFHFIKQKELTEKQIKTREKMINYYKTYNPNPYLIYLKEIY